MSADVPQSEVNGEYTDVDVVRHRVAVFGVPEDTTALCDVLAPLPGMDLATAVQAVHSLPGLLPVVLNRSQAAETATRIRAIGVSATAMPAGDFPDLSQHQSILQVLTGPGEISIRGAAEGETRWRSSSIALIGVGLVPQPVFTESAPTELRGNSSIPPAGRSQNVVRFEACLLSSAGDIGRAYADDDVHHEDLTVAQAQTEPKRGIRQLIRDLLMHSPNAWLTASTHALLDRSPMQHYEFRTRDDFQRYIGFQALLAGCLGGASQDGT